MAKKLEAECYVLVDCVKKGWREEKERIISVGGNRLALRVSASSLGLAPKDMIATRFCIESVNNGTVYGCVYNCMMGGPSGMRSIPLDSIVDSRKVRKYDGRLINEEMKLDERAI